MKNFYQNLKNNLDFLLRNQFDFSRKNYAEQNENKEGLFAEQKALTRENELLHKYDLEEFKNNSTRLNYLENIYYLDIFDKKFPVEFKKELNVLDIGSKNWSYAKSEYFFFKNNSDILSLRGIELDSKRLYANFYSREEVAKFHIRDLTNTEYLCGDFLVHCHKYDYIIWILPFVFKNPLLDWGLPKKYFQPKKMLLNAYNSLNDNGQMFIINQGEDEFKMQMKLCEELNIQYIPIGKLETEFPVFKQERYALLIKN